MLVDCDSCQVRGLRCGDCVVTVLLGMPAMPATPAMSATSAMPAISTVRDLDQNEQIALAALAEGGLVPPLRLVSGG